MKRTVKDGEDGGQRCERDVNHNTPRICLPGKVPVWGTDGDVGALGGQSGADWSNLERFNGDLDLATCHQGFKQRGRITDIKKRELPSVDEYLSNAQTVSIICSICNF